LLGNDKNRIAVQFCYGASDKIVTFNGAGDVLTLEDIFKVPRERFMERARDVCFDAAVELTLLGELHEYEFDFMYDYEYWKEDLEDLRNRVKREELEDLRNHISSELDYCIKNDRWKIGTDSITFYFDYFRSTYIFEIPFSEFSDMLEAGYV
jgi:hypothetical protein